MGHARRISVSSWVGPIRNEMFCFLHHILSNTCLCITLFSVKLYAILRILKQNLPSFSNLRRYFFKVM